MDMQNSNPASQKLSLSIVVGIWVLIFAVLIYASNNGRIGTIGPVWQEGDHVYTRLSTGKVVALDTCTSASPDPVGDRIRYYTRGLDVTLFGKVIFTATVTRCEYTGMFSEQGVILEDPPNLSTPSNLPNPSSPSTPLFPSPPSYPSYPSYP